MSSPTLPIGIQSFEKMRIEGYAYVDKTPIIASLVKEGTYYFFSRPRRFGKSLLIDTIDCAFSGKQSLFKGLYLDSPESGWDWSKKFPVLRIDWSVSPARTPEALNNRIHEILDTWAAEYGCSPMQRSIGGKFDAIVRHIYQQTGLPVVILIDEYDKPILDTLKHPDISLIMRDILRDFYGVLKSLDPVIRFVMLTGISKFVKTGIFSGLNNLNDITLDSRYSAICGYTEDDIQEVFADYCSRFSQDTIRDWYNGYSWTGERVYNPFDILLLFSKGIFRPYWFETGNPAFLLDLWEKNPCVPAEYEGMVVNDEVLGSFDPKQIRTETLLFQTGYLTIRSWESNPDIGTWYTLGFPNREVREAFNRLILSALVPNKTGTPKARSIMEQGDAPGLKELMFSLFASIPVDWYRKNRIAGFEGYYASVLYSWLSSLGFMVIPEDVTNKGRIDLTVIAGGFTWIFEFKIKDKGISADSPALNQIISKGYAEKYRVDSRQIMQVGIVFDPGERNIVRWDVERG